MIPGTRVQLGCSKKSITILVIIFCFSFGILTAIFGVDFCLSNQMVNILLPDMLIIGLSVISLGVLCFISTCIGTCGVINDSLSTIELYGTLLIILTVLYSVLATYALHCSLTFQPSFTEEVIKAFQNYQKSEISRNAVDSLQYLVSCCGLNGPKYWSKLIVIPRACCPIEYNMYLMCSEEMAYKIGCKVKAVEHYENILLPLYVNYYAASVLSLIFGIFMIWNSKTTKISRMLNESDTGRSGTDTLIRISSVSKTTQQKLQQTPQAKSEPPAPVPHKFLGFTFGDTKKDKPKPETRGKKQQPTVMPRAKKKDQSLPAQMPPLSPRKHTKPDNPPYLQPSTSHRK